MFSEITAFIVDAQHQDRILLSNLLALHIPEVRLLGEANSMEQAYAQIEVLDPDVIFLDTQINDKAGADILTRFPKINFKIIFTAANTGQASHAFRLNAIDYLLKPIILSELVQAVEKVKHNKALNHYFSTTSSFHLPDTTHKKPQNKITIPSAEGFIVVALADIVYCEANGNYTKFHLADKSIIVSSYTLKQYHGLLNSQHFMRVHRAYIINTSFIKGYKKSGGGIILMGNGKEIELSRQHKSEFLQLFNR